MSIEGSGASGTRAVFRTFLLSDIRGYSSFASVHGPESTSALAARFGAIASDVIPDFDGEILQIVGDEVLAAFESPRQAVRAAVAFQAALLAATKSDPSLPLPAGVGLDVGEAAISATGWSANAINTAARLCSICLGGDILATREVAHIAQAIDHVSYGERPAVSVKGIPRPVEHVRIFAQDNDAALGFRTLGIAAAAVAPKHPEPEKPRKRRWIVLAAAAVVVAGAGTVTAVSLGGSHNSEPLIANSLASFDAASGDNQLSVVLPEHPVDVAVGPDHSIWITSASTGQVSRYVPATDTTTQITVGGEPSGVCVAPDGSVWVANSADGTVSRINPNSGTVVGTVAVGAGPSALVATTDSVWVANTLGASVSRIAISTSNVTSTIDVGDEPDGITTGGGSIWVADEGDGTVRRLSAMTGAVAQSPIAVGRGPTGMAYGDGAVWVANRLDGTLSRIDAASGQVTTIPVGSGPYDVAVSPTRVWVSLQYDSQIAVIDPAREVVTNRISTGSAPLGLEYAHNRLWAAIDGLGGSAHTGGVLTAAATGLTGVEGDPNSLDPGSAYKAPLWRILITTSDGLVAYDREGGVPGSQLVPDLATALPTPIDHGLSYTFTLRKGIRYSNGAFVHVGDFRSGLERSFKVGGGPTSYLTGLIGGQNCQDKPATCDLSGGVVADPSANTVTFHLTAPDPEFLYQLTLPVAFPVPVGTPITLPTGSSVPGTGPYQVQTFRPASAKQPRGILVLTRNSYFKQWSAAAQPAGFPDRIVINTGYSLSGEASAVTSGKADLMWDQPDNDQINQLQTTAPQQLHSTARPDTGYIWLNTRSAPFNNVLARRAVNFAVDRGRLSAVAGQTPLAGQPTCQLLPPNFPGYVRYCPYTVNPDKSGIWTAPDRAKARDLVARSHTEGASITLVQSNQWPRAIGEELVRELDSIGYHTRIRYEDPQNFYTDSTTDRTLQGGLIGWQSDYVAASNFLNILLDCDQQPPTGNNLGRYCDASLDRLISTALDVQTIHSPHATASWTTVDHASTDAAVLVPIANAVDYSFTARRVGNFQFHPQWGVLVDQLWVH
jgi:peptide/nickel transport system substrate-binding protein